MKGKSESEVAQSCSPPGFSVHGILQARVLEWGAIAFSKGSNKGLKNKFLKIKKMIIVKNKSRAFSGAIEESVMSVQFQIVP